MKKCLYLIFFIKFSLICHAQTVEITGHSKINFNDRKYRTSNFLRDSLINVCITNAKLNAIEKVYGKEIKSNSSRHSEEFIKNNTSNYTKATTVDVFESVVSGFWVKDITPPEITYSKKGKENWITVKVHGYVSKKPNKTEARELLLKQLSAKPLMEDVQVHSIEYYPNDFVVSIVVLDSTNYKSHSEMNRVANILAKRQVLTYFQGSNIEEVFIYKTSADGKFTVVKDEDAQNTYSAVKESSSGWVNAIESLDKVLLKGTNEWVYIFMNEIENL